MTDDRPKISRRRILRSQIETGIWLVGVRQEFVVANMVAHAAIEVLRSLAKEAGKPTFKGVIEKHVNPEAIQFWRTCDRAAYNFAKHADRDPVADLEGFHHEIARLNVFAAVNDYGEVFGELTPPMLIYRSIEVMRRPGLIVPGHFRECHERLAAMLAAYRGEGEGSLLEQMKGMLLAIERQPSLSDSWPPQHIER